MRVLCLSLFLVVALAGQEKGEGKKGPDPFANSKNLKLLMPANLRPAMQNFRTALGVQCNFCHVQGDFASDDNMNKQTARMMITMVRQINSNFPANTNTQQQAVTCYTCHRGAEKPLTAPAAA